MKSLANKPASDESAQMSNGQSDANKTIRELVDESMLLAEQIAVLRERQDDIYAAIAFRAIEMEEREQEQDKT